MTIKEILDYLEHIKVIVPQVLIVEDRKLSHSEICDVIEDIISKVKQLKDNETPKKPIYSDFEEDDDGDGVIANKAECPTCGYEFEFGTWNDHENHHCVCGQKIDWSDYE